MITMEAENKVGGITKARKERENKMTIAKATELWVMRDMDAVQTAMISALTQANPDDWQELTLPAINDYVWTTEGYGEIISHKGYDYTICLDSKGVVHCTREEIDVCYDGSLPMWGTMWSFCDSHDDNWLKRNLQTMSDLGFRIYRSEKFGYFFGIDGAGYDFYEEHWIPLYKARGFQWHDEEEGE